jgi:hypothetical protein
LRTLIIILATIIAQKVFSQDYFVNTERYLKEAVKSDFRERFDTNDKKKDFKELREYLSEKENLLQALNRQQINLQRRILSDTSELERYNDQLLRLINGKTENNLIEVQSSLIQQYRSEVEFSEDYQDTYKVKVAYVSEVIEYYKQQIDIVRESLRKRKVLDQNLINIKQDIYDCQNVIDSALAPEYKQQEFRVTISICFAALIGILLIVFFYIVFKRSDSTLSKELLSGNGLQFVTLFVLIIAIVLFGILNILQGSELAAILSGISGYILGKGTQSNTGS